MNKVRVGHFLRFQCATILTLFGISTASSAQLAEGGQLFDDWVVHCDTSARPDIECRMSQMAIVEETSEALLRINIRTGAPETLPYIQFVLPLGISLRTTPQLELDDKLVGSLPLDMCLADGCYSTFQLSEELLESFLSMYTGRLNLNAGNGEPVSLPISGSGSRAAYDAMQTMANRLRSAGE